MDRLKGAMAVVHEDGTPWTAADFYSCYVGELEWPEPSPPPAPDLTDADAERWSEQYRQWFRTIAESSGRGLLAAAASLIEMVDADEVARFEDVLLGGAAYSADELRALWRPGDGNGGRFLPAAWLDAWRTDLGVTEPLLTTIAGLPERS